VPPAAHLGVYRAHASDPLKLFGLDHCFLKQDRPRERCWPYADRPARSLRLLQNVPACDVRSALRWHLRCIFHLSHQDDGAVEGYDEAFSAQKSFLISDLRGLADLPDARRPRACLSGEGTLVNLGPVSGLPFFLKPSYQGALREGNRTGRRRSVSRLIVSDRRPLSSY